MHIYILALYIEIVRIEKQNGCRIALLINKSVNLIGSAFFRLIFKFNLDIIELGNPEVVKVF